MGCIQIKDRSWMWWRGAAAPSHVKALNDAIWFNKKISINFDQSNNRRRKIAKSAVNVDVMGKNYNNFALPPDRSSNIRWACFSIINAITGLISLLASAAFYFFRFRAEINIMWGNPITDVASWRGVIKILISFPLMQWIFWALNYWHFQLGSHYIGHSFNLSFEAVCLWGIGNCVECFNSNLISC